MTHVTVAGFRRFANLLAGLPGDALVDLEAVARRGGVCVYDPAEDIHVEVRFDVNAIPDDGPMIRAIRSVVGKQAPELERAMLQDLVRSLKKHVEDLPDE